MEILIEVDLGQRAVERCDMFVYLDGKLAQSHFNKSYPDLIGIANELKETYPDAQIEAWCLGEDCCGGRHRWKIDIQ